MELVSTEKTKFVKETNTFHVNGKDVPFTTEYKLVNPSTKGTMEFSMSHSTGSEWDPKTVWVYKSKCGTYELHVGNEDVTPQHAQNYLNHKLNN